ncbi:MAG: caspase family protein [Bacteroidales bacterium]|nr:caspase family protein [Bacteroidales bacterium]
MRTKKIITNKYVVLLIGVSTYAKAKLGDIPNVKANILELKKLFLDPKFIGVNEKNLIVSFNERHDEINRKITDAVELAKSSDYTLFVYYSGHGVISPLNYNLYFASSDIEEKYLEDNSIEAKKLLEKLSRSQASRKILLVDACHSGQIHNTMGDVKSNVASLMKDYEGVQYVTACDEYSSALYPKKNPDVPTYFTGAVLSRVHTGLDIERPYLTLRDIVDDITLDFKNRANMPLPQISSVQSVDKMPFAYNVINKDFSTYDYSALSENSTKNIETQWEKTVKAGTLVAYYDYTEKFPKSKYAKLAEKKVLELEEEEKWQKTLNLGTLFAYESYKKAYPMGKYISVANMRISEFHNLKKDNDMWNSVCNIDTLEQYKAYLSAFPKGCHIDEAKSRVEVLLADKNTAKKFLFLFFSFVAFFMFLMPNTFVSSNGNNNFDTLYAVNSANDDSIKNNVVSVNNGDVYKSAEFKSADNVKKADLFVAQKDEMHYATALKFYMDALGENPDDAELLEKTNSLKRKMDTLYVRYMEYAKIYLEADHGDESAIEMYDMALRMRPNDAKALQARSKLRSK